MNNILKSVFGIVFLNLLLGCLENSNTPENFNYSSSADLLAYYETNGNYINSSDNPAFIDADEVYSSGENYLLLDVRNSSEFNSGHIRNSINVSLDELLETIRMSSNSYSKIVIISASGQKAGYATSLLRLYGHWRTYSLEYGLSKWNYDFYRAYNSRRSDSEYLYQYKTFYYSKPKIENQLPTIEIENTSASIKDISNQRIERLLTEIEYSKAVESVIELDSKYRLINRVYENSFLICYGNFKLYNEIVFVDKSAVPGPIIYGGHPFTAIHYDPTNDFKSSNDLLTLPIDKTIYVYSYNGQRSSYLVPYLRLLGYDARSIENGAESLFFSFIEINDVPESLEKNDVRDYPYDK